MDRRGAVPSDIPTRPVPSSRRGRMKYASASKIGECTRCSDMAALRATIGSSPTAFCANDALLRYRSAGILV